MRSEEDFVVLGGGKTGGKFCYFVFLWLFVPEHAKATLGTGNMRSAVVLPQGEDINEWLAVNSMCLSTPFISVSLLLSVVDLFAFGLPLSCFTLISFPILFLLLLL